MHLGRMKNSSYYIAPIGDRTHDLPHTVASNMVKVSHALNHSVNALSIRLIDASTLSWFIGYVNTLSNPQIVYYSISD